MGFALSAALFIGIGIFAVRRLVELGAANAAVEHTLLVRAEAEGLMSLLTDAETGQRGYIITGQQQYVEPYNTAVAALPNRIANFRRLTADNTQQQQNITTFEGLADRRMAIIRDAISARQNGGFEAAAKIVAAGEGKRVMDAARTVVTRMLSEEDRLWHERGLAQRDHETAVAISSIALLAAAFAVLVIATFFVARR
jgi:CHASE3 domain sensor protein